MAVKGKHLLPKVRGRHPESIHAFESRLWVAGLADRPHDCRCTWVPAFVPVRTWVPVDYDDVRPVTGYQAKGFVLKFRDTDCPAQYRHG